MAETSRKSTIDIAVVGHTNAGKTSLLRTLTRQVRFGEVSDRPGTTRHVEAIGLEVDGRTVMRYFDTPGLEDSVALQYHLKQMPEQLTPPQRVAALLDGPEARGVFEQEAKVLRQMLGADAAIYVIDCREPVLPKYRCEIEVLNTCARPIMPVLNFVRSERSREPEWRELLAAYGLHAAVLFDAVAPFVGAERQLYEDLSVLMRQHKGMLQTVLDDLDRQAAERRAASAQRVADTLISAAAMRREIEPETLADAAGQRTFCDHLPARAGGRRAQVCRRPAADARLRERRRAAGRDAVDQRALGVRPVQPRNPGQRGPPAGQGRSSGRRRGLHAGSGAGRHVARRGHGSGRSHWWARLGQGWGQAPRKLRNAIMGVEELTLDNDVLIVLADSLVHLCQVLQARGHAAQDTIEVRMAPSGNYREALLQLLEPLAQARAHPEWEHHAGTRRNHSSRREALGRALAGQVTGLLDVVPPTGIEPVSSA